MDEKSKEESMNFTDFQKVFSSLGKLKTSTGDTYSFESAAEALIKINILKGELEKAEKALKAALPEEKLPYEGELGKIILKDKTESVQDCKSILESGKIPEDIFWKACKITKSFFDKKDPLGETALKEIEYNTKTEVVGKTVTILKSEKLKGEFDFSIE